MTVKKYIQIAGKRIKLAHMRRSKKGAEVVGARVHIKGLGTVYVQVYEKEELAPPASPPAVPPTPLERRSPQRHVDQTDQLMVEVLRSLSAKVERLEKRAVILPEGTTIPNPHPSNGHPR